MQAIHVGLFLACLSGSTCIPVCTASPALINEHDMQDDLSLIQKKAARHQSHVQGQGSAGSVAAVNKQPEAEDVGKEPAEKSGEEPREAVEEEPGEEAPGEGREEREERERREEQLRAAGVENVLDQRLRPWIMSLRRGCRLAQGITILGSLSFIMSIFYLVNSASPLVNKTAWDIVSGTSSILVAVLTYNSVNKAINMVLGITKEAEEEREVAATWEEVVVYALMGVFWSTFVSMGLFFCTSSPLHLRALGTVGGHILGFAYIHTNGAICTLPEVEKSQWLVFLVCICYLTLFPPILSLSMTLPSKLIMASGLVSERSAKIWYEQAWETSIESFVMCGSFLLSMWVRFVISGHAPPLGRVRMAHSYEEDVRMLLVCLFCFVTAAVLTRYHESRYGEIAEVTSHVFAMTGAWVLLFVIHWVIYIDWKNTFSGDTVVALTNSMCAIVGILVCYMLRRGFAFTRRSLRGALVGFAIAVGLSWEHVFDNSIESFEVTGINDMNTIMAEWVLIVILTPAWMLYMLPHADEVVSSKMSDYLKTGALPFSAIWSAADFYNKGVQDEE